ncbi:recombinase RecD [Clostridia bacterium]|nr:recombinase RecD [Clostridia bacterium]
MKGVIYARYSSDNQREESIEGQIRECKEFAEKNGITIFSSYIDRAMSAKTDNRPEFQRMIKDSAKHLFDVIIVWKLDRFARNRYDSAHNKAILRKNGVKVVSATEHIAEDSTGILLESLLEGYAEFYSAELSEKVIRGMTENALKLKYNGGGLPIGYTIDEERHFQLDTVTAPLILEAFTLYSKGKLLQEVTDYLNEKGLRTRNNRPLNSDNTTRMLKNRKYTGEYKYRDIVYPGGIPAIVPMDLYDRVQERFAKNQKAPARFKAEEIYLLTTKIRCGLCGAFMVGESGTSATGRTYNYYKCVNNKNKKGCKKKSARKDWIENLVIEQIVELIFNDPLMEYLADMVMDLQARENTNLPLLRKQLAEAENSIDNMLNAIQQGILTSSTKKRLEDLEQRKSDLEVSILQEELQKPLLTRDQVLFWLHKFREMDISNADQRQRLVDGFINAIYLYDDKLVLTFNYKDGSKTVSLKEIESSDLGARPAPFKKSHNHAVCGAFFFGKVALCAFFLLFFLRFFYCIVLYPTKVWLFWTQFFGLFFSSIQNFALLRGFWNLQTVPDCVCHVYLGFIQQMGIDIC